MIKKEGIYADCGVAVVGAGYWGKNHVRNFFRLGALAQICDLEEEIRTRMTSQYPDISYTDSYEQVLANSDVRGVVLATPAVTHYRLAKAALEAGKDVLVEKPLALNIKDAQDLVTLAAEKRAILMVGHILLYHPAVVKLKELVDSGYLGKIQYIQSNRLSMGIVRSEENILWSFAPHDVSVLLHLLGEMPTKVNAYGVCQLQDGVEDVTISVMEFGSGVGAHVYVSWMNPFKEQKLVVVGDKRMAVFEDSRPENKLQVFNNSFAWVQRHPVPIKGEVENVQIENAEPLYSECLHFLECVRTRQRPKSDAEEGYRTLSVLMKCYESLKQTCTEPEAVETVQHTDYFAHPTSEIEQPCSIGSGTKIWHFSHVSPHANIGKNCNIGQNVVVGKNVTIGNNCKIQNNVCIYEGVTLEDYVFCGPSMVFTNVYNPRSEIPRMKELRPTLVRRGATIGANATIVCGTTIGRYAFIGAGAVVKKDVDDYALVVGNPARRIGYVCKCGHKLHEHEDSNGLLKCTSCNMLYGFGADSKLEEYSAHEAVTKVALLDLKSQYLSIKDEIDLAIKKTVESQRFILGPDVEALEREIAQYCGCSQAIGVSSGTDALLIALMALEVEPGDEVITTPFTFFATVGSIARLGAVPVFADIDPLTFNIDPTRIERLITPRTKAILPVHLFGQCADMGPLLEISEKYGIPIVEDAAQAVGSEYNGKRAGSMGAFGCFSFFPSKNLGAFGDGGMVTTNDDALADRVRMLRNHGAKPKYFHKLIGGNFRLDGIQAGILRVKLKHLDKWTEKRVENAAYYTGRLHDLGLSHNVTPPYIGESRHIFNQYVVIVENRDQLKQYLKDHGVETEIYYPRPMHLQECFDDGRYTEGSFPVSEQASKHVLALPVYPELSTAQKEYVLTKIRDFYQPVSRVERPHFMYA